MSLTKWISKMFNNFRECRNCKNNQQVPVKLKEFVEDPGQLRYWSDKGKLRILSH